MLAVPIPADEKARLAALLAMNILDTPREERFNRITRLAVRLFDVPIAVIGLIDANRQWYKACIGLENSEVPRSVTFCSHAIMSDEPLVIPDATNDPRFAHHPMVTNEPHVRFYAGQPLSDVNGYKLGTLCIVDFKPHKFDAADIQALKDLGASVEHELNNVELGRALAEQRASAARIHALMDSVPDGIITLDSAGNIESFNEAAERLFGLSAEEAVGASVGRLIPGLTQPFADGRLMYESGGWAAQNQSACAELPGQHKDGSTFPLELTFGGLTQGDRKLIICIVRDISSRKRVEADLHKMVAELRSLYITTENARSETRAVLDATSEGIALIGPDRRFLTINRRFSDMFSVAADEVRGHTFSQMQAMVDRTFLNADTFRARMTGTASDTSSDFTDQVVQIWPEKRDLEMFSTPVRTADDIYLGRLYVFRDVSRERAAERAKSEFVSMVSHELRTPLTSIKGYIDLILEGDAGDVSVEQTEFLQVVQSNTERLVMLINDLLDVSRIEEGRIELNRKPTVLRDLVHVAASSLRPQIAAKRQQLSIEIPDDLPPALVDPHRITQVITNLLSNAYKYTPAGGQITISAAQEDGLLCVRVRDTGIGLSEEDRAKVFNRFFRANNRATREVGGTGLGLSITRALVQMHGGEISLESAPNQGSTFSFTVPLAPLPDAGVDQVALMPVPMDSMSAAS